MRFLSILLTKKRREKAKQAMSAEKIWCKGYNSLTETEIAMVTPMTAL
jgi:hypothetical protein